MDSSNDDRRKDHTPEERRFILWAIARANAKKEPGPYIDGIPVEPKSTLQPIVQDQPTVNRVRKKPQYFRNMLLSSSTKTGALCGGLIGLNVGVLVALSANNLFQGCIYLTVATAFTAILGMVVARRVVLNRRSDLFHARLNWCCSCPLLQAKK